LVEEGDVVLDVGAGFGFLTRYLAAKCKGVLAVESDVRLVRCLRERMCGLSNVRIIVGDALRVQIPEFDKVVSVPPYHISSRLLSWLFGRSFDCAVLVLQKEFGGRLVASVGSDGYGWLSVLGFYYVDVELLDDVPRWMFYPQPEVDSVVVRLRRKRVPPFRLKDEVLFKRVVQALFRERNRKVRNAFFVFVKGLGFVGDGKVRGLVGCVPFGDRRVRDLAPEDFGVLVDVLLG